MTRRPAVAAILLLVTRLAGAATVEYLHVEAGEGNSAGGHAAIRFGDDVYHFQHRAPGLLVPARTNAGTFFWHYGVRENRRIRRAAVTVDVDTFERLRHRFNTRYLVERRAAAVVETLRRDRARLDAWADGTAGAPVPAAALFEAAGAHSSALAGVAAPVALAHIAQRQRDAIARLDVTVAPVTVDDAGVPDAGYRISQRYDDLVTRLVAVEALAAARRVRPELLVVAPDDVPPLGDLERVQLIALKGHVAARLAQLLEAARPDWGTPLVVGMARLQAIEATLATGRLTVVVSDAMGDGLAAAPPSLSADDRRDYAREVGRAARRRLADARLASLGGPGLDEQRLTRIERALRDVVTSDARAAGSGPAAADFAPPLPRPAHDASVFAEAAARAARIEADYLATLRGQLAYGLLDHNCVTEIFRTIDTELTPAESTRLLGGHVAVDVGPDVVPARSFDLVRATWTGATTSELPSYRQRRVDAMCREEPAAVVRLREGNVVTSTLYRPTDEDSAFLFFTDDTPLARPLYGLANLAYGTATTGVGLLALPLDRGRTLRRGAAGVVASVPELAFVSIRKGRMVHGPEPSPAE